ncbi:MAG: hypothetical protein WCO45_06495 [Pseudanabaena sp. ELA607]
MSQLDAIEETKRKIVTVLLILSASLASIILLWLWLFNLPPDQVCPNLTSSKANSKKHLIIPASKLYITPWAGQHRVYGLFLVPNQYKFNPHYISYLIVINPDEMNPIDETSTLAKYDDLVAPQGYYISRNYLTTRQSLGYIMTGRSGDLQQPCQWQMHIMRQD